MDRLSTFSLVGGTHTDAVKSQATTEGKSSRRRQRAQYIEKIIRNVVFMEHCDLRC